MSRSTQNKANTAKATATKSSTKKTSVKTVAKKNASAVKPSVKTEATKVVESSQHIADQFTSLASRRVWPD